MTPGASRRPQQLQSPSQRWTCATGRASRVSACRAGAAGAAVLAAVTKTCPRTLAPPTSPGRPAPFLGHGRPEAHIHNAVAVAFPLSGQQMWAERQSERAHSAQDHALLASTQRCYTRSPASAASSAVIARLDNGTLPPFHVAPPPLPRVSSGACSCVVRRAQDAESDDAAHYNLRARTRNLGIRKRGRHAAWLGWGTACGLVSLNRDQGQDSGCGQLFINAVNGNMRGDLDLAGYNIAGLDHLWQPVHQSVHPTPSLTGPRPAGWCRRSLFRGEG